MRHGLSVLLLAAATLHSIEKRAEAAEAATGVYLLGSRAVGAGITPPPGPYVQDDTFFCSGKIGGGTTLPVGWHAGHFNRQLGSTEVDQDKILTGDAEP